MAPQRKGVIPEPQLSTLVAAGQTASLARAALRFAVVDALKAGGSVREVAEKAGISTSTCRLWGQSDGWPTPEQRAAWAADREKHLDWNRRMEVAQALIDHLDA